MICASKTGQTDTRGSFWGQESMNIFHRTFFLKLKPIPWSLWSPQVMSSPSWCAGWASREQPESKQEWQQALLHGLQAGTHPAGTLRAACPTQPPHYPNGWTRESPQLRNTSALPRGAGSYYLRLGVNREPREHIFWGRPTTNKLLLYSELCLGTFVNTLI